MRLRPAATSSFWTHRRTTMLQVGEEVTLYSVVFVVVLLGTRCPVLTTVLTASLYLFLSMFRFPQVPASQAWQVLHPAGSTVGSGKVSVVAHRGGGHDAPENTIAAIREVRGQGGLGLLNAWPLSLAAPLQSCLHDNIN